MLLNSSDVAVDVETLGKRNNAAILSIGAVKFDPNGNVLGDAFYVDVDPASCVALGMTIDISTIMWWMGQGRTADGALIYDESRDLARKAMVTADRIDLASALYGFNEWFGPVSLPVWGNGSTFDNVILTSAYEAVGMDRPWEFWHDKCYRTIKGLAPDIKLIRQGTFHNALDDARSQAEHQQRIYQHLGLGQPRAPEPFTLGPALGNTDGS